VVIFSLLSAMRYVDSFSLKNYDSDKKCIKIILYNIMDINSNSNSNSNSITLSIDGNSNSKFRFQGIKMFMTYPGHHGTDLIDMINEVMSNDRGKNSIDEFIVGREKGESDYLHTHVVLKFKKKLCFQNCRKFDYKGVHPKIEPVRDWAEAVHYAAKDGDIDTNIDLANLVPIQKKIDRVMMSKTPREALKNAQSMSDVVPILKMFEMKRDSDQCPFEPLKELRPWQKDLLTILNDCNSNRTIHWVHDKHGGSGKTSLQKHIMATTVGTLIIPGAATSSNINEAIRSYLEQNDALNFLLINLARGSENYDSIYQTLEQVKDQMMFCPKYKSRTILLSKSPTVCIFANATPCTSKLTLDRWRLYELCEGIIASVPVTLGTTAEGASQSIMIQNLC